MDDEWTEVIVRGVVIDPISGEPAVLIEDSDECVILAVPADPASAASIIAAVEGELQSTPEDLLLRFFHRHGVTVSAVAMRRRRDGSIAATLCYSMGGNTEALPVRPADGLVISARTNAPVLIHGSMVEHPTPRSAMPRVSNSGDLLILS